MIKVKADATDQTVSGSLYFDTIVIRVVDERSIEETRGKKRESCRDLKNDSVT
jgi:hypothetical protein